MAEGSGFRINPAMGIELRAGHVHRDRQGRSPAPSQSHRPAGRKRVQQYRVGVEHLEEGLRVLT